MDGGAVGELGGEAPAMAILYIKEGAVVLLVLIHLLVQDDLLELVHLFFPYLFLIEGTIVHLHRCQHERAIGVLLYVPFVFCAESAPVGNEFQAQKVAFGRLRATTQQAQDSSDHQDSVFLHFRQNVVLMELLHVIDYLHELFAEIVGLLDRLSLAIDADDGLGV